MKNQAALKRGERLEPVGFVPTMLGRQRHLPPLTDEQSRLV
ncbi:hypothetical protein [Sedimentitalea sp.]